MKFLAFILYIYTHIYVRVCMCFVASYSEKENSDYGSELGYADGFRFACFSVWKCSVGSSFSC